MASNDYLIAKFTGRYVTDTDCQNEADIVEVMNQFILDLGLPRSLREVGNTESMIDQMTDEVIGNIQNDPAVREEDIAKKYIAHHFEFTFQSCSNERIIDVSQYLE